MEKPQKPVQPMGWLERLGEVLFGLACKTLTVTMAVGFLLDKLFNINLIKLF